MLNWPTDPIFSGHFAKKSTNGLEGTGTLHQQTLSGSEIFNFIKMIKRLLYKSAKFKFQ